MLTVQFDDHSEAVMDRLRAKLLAAVGAAAETLAEGYRTALQATVAPPHSNIGEIPHAYLGWKPGGYGPTNPTGINNIPPQFQSVQSDYLSSYISHGSSGLFGMPVGFVGFRPSHVGGRADNYLLEHDLYGRPWVRPVYDDEKSQMASRAKAAFERTD